MLKKTITYEDFEGNTKTRDFYFNLTKTEIIKMETSEVGGLTKLLGKIIQEEDQPKIMEYFDRFISMSYGEKSADGQRFIKSPELSAAFFQCPAYDVLFLELMSDPKAAAEFVNAIVPKHNGAPVEAPKTAADFLSAIESPNQ